MIAHDVPLSPMLKVGACVNECAALADCLRALTAEFWLYSTGLPFLTGSHMRCRYPGQAERFEQRLQGLTAKFRNLHLPPRITDRSSLPRSVGPPHESAHLPPPLSPLLLAWKADLPAVEATVGTLCPPCEARPWACFNRA